MLRTHNRYRYVPIAGRRPYEWPQGKRLAVFTVVNVEVFPFAEGLGIPIAPAQAEPDTVNFSYRDWGNRVGFFRLTDLFGEFGFPASMFLNSEIFEHCPQIVSTIRERGDEIAGHGRTNSERQASFAEPEERRAIQEATEVIRRHTGKAPTGWMSPWVAESLVTPDLLQEAGYLYLMEWSADDQPIWMKTRGGRILSIPYPRPTNDLPMMHAYHMNPELYANILIDQFDETLQQSTKMPLSFCLSFHPYLSGHAFRIRQLRRVFQHISRHAGDVWLARAGEIAAHVAALPAGVVPGSDG